MMSTESKEKGAAMSLEANKEIVRRLFEDDLNTDNRDAADDIVAPDFVDHTNPPEMKYGLEGHKRIVALFRMAFPDLKFTIMDMLAEGDRVAVRAPFEGTHILCVADGKVAEHWGSNDDLGLMRQL